MLLFKFLRRSHLFCWLGSQCRWIYYFSIEINKQKRMIYHVNGLENEENDKLKRWHTHEHEHKNIRKAEFNDWLDEWINETRMRRRGGAEARRKQSGWQKSLQDMNVNGNRYVCFVITPSVTLLFSLSFDMFLWMSVYLCVKEMVDRTFTKVIGKSYMLQKYVRFFSASSSPQSLLIAATTTTWSFAITNFRTFSLWMG